MTRHLLLSRTLLLLTASLFSAHASGQSRLYEFNGDAALDLFGHSVSGAGDVNADGRADLIVGAFGDDTGGAEAGSASVLSGTDGSVLLRLDGPAPGAWFGYSVSGVGDVNHDGHDDVAVGAPRHVWGGAGEGSVRVFSGLDGSVLHTFLGAGYFGYAIDGAGDVNADGTPDVVVGAPYADYAEVFSGSDGTLLYTLPGGGTYTYGRAVSGAGDANGDGHDDVIVGDPRNWEFNDTGSAYLYSGKDGSLLRSFHGSGGAWIWFAASVSGAGDVNADGFDDQIIGSPVDELLFDAGSARVFSGLDGSLLHEFVSSSPDDINFGFSVDGAGDLDRDGHADVIVNVRDGGYQAISPGSARVYSGRTGEILKTFHGESINDGFGRSVSAAGDVNGDGRPDLILGALGDDNNGSASGSAIVVPCCDFLGELYCSPAVPSSTGTPGTLTVTGSVQVADNDVSLTAASLPAGTLALFLASENQATPLVAALGQGLLCLRAPLARFSAQLQESGASGIVSIDADLTDIPGLGAVLPGSSWYFQCLYRDSNPTSTVNLTDAIEVVFE